MRSVGKVAEKIADEIFSSLLLDLGVESQRSCVTCVIDETYWLKIRSAKMSKSKVSFKNIFVWRNYHSVFKTGKQCWDFVTTNFGGPTFEVYQHDERLAKSLVCFGPTHGNAGVLYGNIQNYRSLMFD